ncbi:BTAD domain-containing putative transcriptional regulator [Streptomyces sp. NPDC050560]|uniref:AfsR/SARP family transcriptional regulator n=1 Tax=Streptomyces sp. NPDC050560 TaxID=3365630 RepID=UPI0037A76E36
MQFRILGTPELYEETGDRCAPLGAPKPRLLLATLLTRPNSPVPREVLVREMWGAEPPVRAFHSLNAHVSFLRRTLLRLEPQGRDTPRLVARASGYALRVRPGETDHGLFGRRLARARRTAAHDPEGAHATLRAALALWRGPVLGGAPYGPAFARLAAGLERDRADAMELAFDCALRTGLHERVLPELREAVAAQPLRERFHDQLMLALCRCGRPAEAIGVYQRARRDLAGVAGGHTPLLAARLEQISVCSPVLTDPAAAPGPVGAPAPAAAFAERAADPSPRSVMGYLTDLLSGQVLAS